MDIGDWSRGMLLTLLMRDGIPHPSSYIEISHCPAVAVPLDFGCRAHICYIYVASGYRTDNRELRSERQGRGSPRAPRPPGARASSVFSVLPLRQTGDGGGSSSHCSRGCSLRLCHVVVLFVIHYQLDYQTVCFYRDVVQHIS